jgi:hypothetical protein
MPASDAHGLQFDDSAPVSIHLGSETLLRPSYLLVKAGEIFFNRFIYSQHSHTCQWSSRDWIITSSSLFHFNLLLHLIAPRSAPWRYIILWVTGKLHDDVSMATYYKGSKNSCSRFATFTQRLHVPSQSLSIMPTRILSVVACPIWAPLPHHDGLQFDPICLLPWRCASVLEPSTSESAANLKFLYSFIYLTTFINCLIV